MKIFRKKMFLILVIILALFLGAWLLLFHESEKVNHCLDSHVSHDKHNKHGHDKHNTEAQGDMHKDDNECEHHEENIVKLTKEQLEEFVIKVSTAKSGDIYEYIKLTGEIIIIPDRLAHITPRFPGIVKKIHKRIGDKVYKGEVLAVIESNESLTTYKVKSFIKGKVIDMHISMGEVISSDNSDHGFVVADLTKVWANFNVYQNDLNSIKIGQKVIITGPGSEKITGNISYISPIVDKKTRTSTARVALPNRNGNWRPGIFITGNVVTKTTNVPIIIPKSAILTFEGQKTIFIKTEAGFQPQKVSTGISNEKYYKVTNGLEKGQTYVSKGGFIIKAELMKESFGGCNH